MMRLYRPQELVLKEDKAEFLHDFAQTSQRTVRIDRQ